MKTVAIVLLWSILVTGALGSPDSSVADALVQRFEACSSPLMRLDAAISAKFAADEEYVNIYAGTKYSRKDARAAFAKAQSMGTAATILGYRLVGATPESTAKLQAVENALNSDLENLIEPTTAPSKAQLHALMRKVDAEGADVEAIQETMNVTLGIPPNTRVDAVFSGFMGPHQGSFNDLLLAQNNKCRARLLHEMQTDKANSTDAISIPTTINLENLTEQLQTIQHELQVLQQLQQQLNDMQKLRE